MPDDDAPQSNEAVTRKMTAGGGGLWEPPTIEEAAALFPGYEVIALLGRGGMGAVYQARQIELDRLVAIKLLPLEISADADFADRFRREARAMAKLNHPNIITVYDFGTTSAGHLFFVMEFVEGANLHAIIRAQELSADQALWLAGQVCTALAYAHSKGVVHRDIKPANVMVDTEGNAKVADFGLARLTDTGAENLGHTQTGTVMGTPDYMAPEQMRGMNVDHRADIYSVGVMLYEMLCREVPRGIFSPPSVRTGCDHRVDSIVVKAMQSEPDRRYQSTQEMKTDVEAARVPMPTTQPRVVQQPRAVAKERRLAVAGEDGGPVKTATKSRRSLVLIIASVLVIGGLAFLLTRPAKPKPVAAARPVEKTAHTQDTPPPKPPPPSPTGKPIAGTGAKPAPPPGSPVSVPASTTKNASAPEQWVDLLQMYFAQLADQQRQSAIVERVPEGARFNAQGAFNLPFAGTRQNVALRASVRGIKKWLMLAVRSSADADGKNVRNYRASLGPDGSGRITRKDVIQSTAETPVRSFGPIPGFDPAARHMVEFRAVDDVLTFIVDGQAMATVRDATLEKGGLSLTGDAGMIVEKLEMADLTGLKSAATVLVPPASMTGNASVPEPWVDVLKEYFARPADKVRQGVIEQSPDGAKVKERRNLYPAGGAKQNVALRATVRGIKESLVLVLRNSGTITTKQTLRNYQAQLKSDGSVIILRKDMSLPVGDVELRRYAPSPGFSPTAAHTFEFRAVDDVLTASVDGRVLEPVRDASIASGDATFVGDPGMIVEKLELADLGAPPPAAGPTGKEWIDGLAEWLAGRGNATKGVLVQEGNGWRYKGPSAVQLGDKLPGKSLANLAVRMTFRQATGTINLRTQSGNSKTYRAMLSKDGSTEILRLNDQERTVLHRGKPPAGFDGGASRVMEFRAEGEELTLLVDGQLVGSAKDATYRAGSFNVSPLGALIEKLEYRDLGGASAPATSASSSPAAATKDAPFVNSLGMKFVPVPGTKVLFSIWHTRVADYAAYARVNTVDGSWMKQARDGVPVSREPDHPVSGVNWAEATAFCQWLTEKESAEGRIPTGFTYRLPTDEEWSRAVGLANEQGATPMERSGKNRTDFPWGSGYPPPRGKVGNYADETFHAKFPKDAFYKTS